MRRKVNGYGAGRASVTVRDLVRRLNVTHATIYNWRDGTHRRSPLPVQVRARGGANRVWFNEKELVAWLRQYRPDLVNQWQSAIRF